MERTDRYIFMILQIWKLNFNFFVLFYVSARASLRTDGQVYIKGCLSVRPYFFNGKIPIQLLTGQKSDGRTVYIYAPPFCPSACPYS